MLMSSGKLLTPGARLRRALRSSQTLATRTLASSAAVSETNDKNKESPLTNMAHLSETQRALFNSYVATGRGSSALFGSIDTDSDGNIKGSDVRLFVNSIANAHAVMDRALLKLDLRSEDHNIDIQEFQQWLIDATHEAGYQSFATYYDLLPDVGERSDKKPEQKFAWNSTTMSQSLRRMQYAVRGEVVIKADKLASEGREIIYTNIGNPHSVGQKPVRGN
jgi:hypothetical protein